MKLLDCLRTTVTHTCTKSTNQLEYSIFNRTLVCHTTFDTFRYKLLCICLEITVFTTILHRCDTTHTTVYLVFSSLIQLEISRALIRTREEATHHTYIRTGCKCLCDIAGILDHVEEYLPLSVSFFGKGDFYALRASGSSMTGAQIDDGDLVIIRQQHTAQVGEIVVALTDEDKNTLKRLLYDDDRQSYYLHPENKDMEDIYVSGLRVQGVATHVIKAL